MFSFVYPPIYIVAAISWCLYQAIRASLDAWRQPAGEGMPFALAWGSVAVFASAYLLGNLFRLVGVLTYTAYLSFVAPFTLFTFIIVWGLPAWTYRKYLRRTRTASLKVKEEMAKEMRQVASELEELIREEVISP